MSARLLLLLCWFAGGSVAAADIYECRGKNGAKHYTNVRPRKGGCRRIVRSSHRSKPKSSQRRATPVRPPPPADRYRRFDSFIREASRMYQIPEPFLRAVMRVESDFNPGVVSHAGAMGLMQLMPRTASAMGVHDPFNPRENILGGARYLRILANVFQGDMVLTLAAYNAGEGAVTRYKGVPPYRETRRYVQNVLRHYYKLALAH